MNLCEATESLYSVGLWEGACAVTRKMSNLENSHSTTEFQTEDLKHDNAELEFLVEVNSLLGLEEIELFISPSGRDWIQS